ncbi:MAG: hypothetical protein J5768_01535 [Spirochaetales bacterium]|nr:hypothetical protein [Spirochaetales bacterium]
METRKRHAVSLVFLFLAVAALVCSCSNAQKAYDSGNYSLAVSKLSKIKDPTPAELILKARSYLALGESHKALESLYLYLMSDPSAQDSEDRSYAVTYFLSLNTSDNLTIMAVSPDDGPDAMKALYKAYARLGDTESAKAMLKSLSDYLDFKAYITLMLSAPFESDFILDSFISWYSTIDEQELDSFLSLLSRFSNDTQMGEDTAKRFLALTDVLMGDTFFTDNNLNLSVLLKIKGNILEKLFDKVNARIYWTQALRLNPDDEELKGRLQ